MVWWSPPGPPCRQSSTGFSLRPSGTISRLGFSASKNRRTPLTVTNTGVSRGLGVVAPERRRDLSLAVGERGPSSPLAGARADVRLGERPLGVAPDPAGRP